MKEPLGVALQRRAEREIEEIDAWWRKNRPAAPDLFVVELEGMLEVVALMPSLGAPAKSERARDVRRVALKRTRYHVYYRVRNEVLQVLAVWHAMRGKGPGL
jgi:plasmid stabilization system protein ParE